MNLSGLKDNIFLSVLGSQFFVSEQNALQVHANLGHPVPDYNLSFVKRKDRSSVTDLQPSNHIPQCQNSSLFIVTVSQGSTAIRPGVLPPICSHQTS